MNAKRAGAVILALALIGGALLLRRNVIEGDDGEPSSTNPPPADASSLTCITELAEVCRGLADAHPELTITIEDAGVTLDRLAALPDDAAAPMWLTIEPYPAMVDSLRTGAGRAPLGDEPTVLAASRLAVAMPAGGRQAVLETACVDERLWRCIGDHAGAPWTTIDGEPTWGTVRPSLGDVEQSATALASFAAAVGGYVGQAEYSPSELDTPSIPWLRRLAHAVRIDALSGGTPLATMDVRPSALDVAATNDAELAATGSGFDVNYPEPSMWLQAVLAAPDEVSGELRNDVTAALSAAGWGAAVEAAQPLPSASTMLALRTLWQDAT